MTYREALDWMYGQLPMYQQKGISAFKGKMDTIVALADYLQNPQLQFPSIHVAGTNGKGSSSHMIASILQEAGYKTGLYTSPHLKDFRERIKINGVPVGEEYVVKFIDSNKGILENYQASFFEMTVAMAFAYFASEKVDVAVIEVGLGGRLDSTNIITPMVSLITNIGMDHVSVLGPTLEDIAREKGGVIKEGVPVVISETQEVTAEVFRAIAAEKNSVIVFADCVDHKRYKTDLLGDYQQQNIKGVLSVIDQLRALEIPDNAIESGLQQVVNNTGLLGRWQILGDAPKIICDTAHNREGIALVVKQLKREQYKQLHVILGVVKEKELEPILELLPKEATYYFAKAAIPRGLDAETLRDAALEFHLSGAVYASVTEAFETARSNASEEDLIFVGGSTFTVAEVL